MKKNKFVITTTLALLTAATISVACKAPGSSEELKKGGEDIYEKNLPPTNSHQVSLPSKFVQPPDSKTLYDSIFSKPKQPIQTPKRVKSANFISLNDQIKYVAIGDSITEGFDGSLPRSYPGKLEADGSISGVSYPAYLARLLNQKHRVSAFDNFAVSGSRLIDWIKLLDIPFTETNPSLKDSVDLGIFGDNYQQKAAKIKAKLRDANLVTFTLSANDILFLLIKEVTKQDVTTILQKFLKNKAIAGDVLVFVNKLFNNALRETQKRLLTFVSNLRNLAPKANINFINYPTPMLGIANIVKEYISKLIGQELEISPFEILINILNNGIKEVAERSGINYVNVVNETYWNSHTAKLTSLFFDIHPNTYGYKKMAMDLYLKITNPSLSVKDYANYDFTQEYLDSDAKTANYQIEVDTSRKDLFGSSSDIYLDNKRDFELDVDDQRNVANFGNRIAELTQTFLYAAKEIIHYLTNNAIYHQLDPQGLLANLLNSQLDSGKKADDSVVESLIKAHTLQNILYQLETNLSVLRTRNELTLERVMVELKNSILNIDNIALLLSTLANSELMQTRKNELNIAIKTIANNALKVFSKNINAAIIDGLSASLKKYNISSENIAEIGNSIWNSKHLKVIIDLLVDSFTLHPENFTNATTMRDFFTSLFGSEEVNNQLAEHIVGILLEVLKNKQLQQLAAESLYNFLNVEGFAKDITQQQISDAIADLLQLVSDVNDKYQLFDKLTKGFLNNIQIFGLSNIPDLIERSFQSVIIDQDNQNIDKSLILELIKTLVNPDLLSKHKPLIKQLLKNSLDSNNILKIAKAIAQSLQETSLNKYLSKDTIEKFLLVVFKQPQMHNILTSGIEAIIDNSSKLANAKDFNDLLVQALTLFPLNELKSQLLELVNNVLNDPITPEIIQNVLTNSLSSLHFDVKDAQNAKFITDFSNQILPWIKEQNLVEPILDAIVNQLNMAKTSDNPLQVLQNIPNKIVEVFKDKFAVDTITKIKSILNLPFLHENAEAASKVAKILIDTLIKKGVVVNAISTPLQNLLESQKVNKFVDKDEIFTAVLAIINSEQGSQILSDSLLVFIKNPNLLDHINNTKEFINLLFQNADFKAILQNDVKPLLQELINKQSFAKTFAKLIKYLANENSYQIDEKYQVILENIYPSLLQTLKQNNVLQPLIEATFEVLNNNTNIDTLANELLTKLTKVINFTDLNLYKTLLTTPLFNENKELLKQMLLSLFNTFKDQHLSAILDSLLPQQILTASKEEVKSLILKFANKQEFINLFNSISTFIIDHNQNLANTSNLTELINVFLKDQNLIKSNQNNITNLINDLKADATFKKLLKEILLSNLNLNSVSWIFTNTTNKDALISDLIDYVLTALDSFNVISHLFEAISEYTNSNSNNPLDIITIFMQKISVEFTTDKLQSKTIELLKKLPNNFISKHKSDLKQILDNIYEHYKTDEHLGSKLISILPLNILNTVHQYASDDLIDKIVYALLNTQSLKTLFTNLVSDALDNISDFKNIQTFEQLLKTLLATINKDTLQANLTKLVESIFANNELLTDLADVLAKFIKTSYPSFYSTQTKDFLATFLPEVYDWIKELGIDEVVYQAVKNLVSINDSENINQKLNEVKNSLTTNLTTKLIQNITTLIKKIYASNAFASHKDYLKQVINNLFNLLLNNIESFKDSINTKLVELGIISEQHKLTETQLQQFVTLIQRINNLDSNNTLISKLLDIPSSKIESVNTQGDLINVFLQHLLESLNLNDFAFAKTILTSDFINNSDLLKDIASKLIQKYIVKENTDKWIAQLNLSKAEADLGFNSGELTQILQEVLSKPEANEILQAVAKKVFDNITTVKNADSYNSLIKSILNINGLKEEIKPKFVTLIKQLLTSSNVTDKLKHLIKSFFNNPTVAEYLAGVKDTDALANNIIGLYDIIDKQLNLSELVFEAAYEGMLQNGVNLNTKNIFNSIVTGFKQRLNQGSGQEANVIQLVKNIIKSGLFANNKNDLLTIITNVINKFVDGSFVDGIINSLSESTKAELAQYIPIDSFKNIAKVMLKNSHFISLLKSTILKMIEHINEFDTVNSYIGMFKKVFNIISLEEVKTNVKGIVDDLLTNSEVNNALYVIVKRLLKANGVNVDVNSTDNFIHSFINNLNDILQRVDLLNPLIETTFNKLKEALSADDNQVAAKLQQLPKALLDLIEQKVINQPKTFVDSLLSSDQITQNKTEFISIVTQLLKHLKTSSLITNTINTSVDNLSLGDVSNFISKTDIKKLIDLLIKDEFSNQTIDVIIPKLLNNTDWLNNLNNPFILIKNLLSNSEIATFLKNNPEAFLTRMFNNADFANITLSIIDKVLIHFKLYLNGINKVALFKDLLSQIIPLLKQINVYQPLVNLVVDSFQTTDSFETYAAKLKVEIPKLFNFNFSVLSSILNHLSILSNHKTTTIEILNRLYSQITNNDTFLDKILSLLINSNVLNTTSLDLTLLKNVVKTVLKDSEVKSNLNSILENLLSRYNNIKDADSYSSLIQKIFNDDSLQTQLKALLHNMLTKIINNNDFNTLVAKFVVAKLENSEYNQIFKSINEKEKAVKLLLDVAKVVDKQIPLSQTFINESLHQLAQNGSNYNLSDVLNKLLSALKDFLSSENYESKVLALLNQIASLDTISQNRELFNHLVENIAQILINKIDFGTPVWGALGDYYQNYISNNFINREQFVALINTTLKVDSLKSVITDIVRYYVDHKNQFSNSHTFLDIYKNYLKDNGNQTKFKTSIKKVLSDGFSSNATIESVKSIINKSITFLNVNVTNEISTFINALATDFGNFLNRLQIFDNVANALVSTVLEANSFNDFKSKVGSKIIAGLNFTDYGFFKKLINDTVISQHKTGVKSLIKQLVTNLLNNRQKTAQVIKDLNVAKLIVDNGVLKDRDFINDAIILALNDRNIGDIINLIIEDAVDNAQSYEKADNWWGAINILFKSSHTQQFKEKLTNWVKKIFSSPDPKFAQGVAQIFIAKLKQSGYAFSEEHDLSLITGVLSTVMHVLSGRNELEQIISHIYDNIKAIDFNKNRDLKQVNKAIIDGFLYMFLSNDRSTIELGKIVRQKEFFRAIVNGIGDYQYIKLLNRFFEVSDLTKRTGIYKFIESFSSPTKNNSGANDGSNNQSYKFSIGGNLISILQNANELQYFLSTFFSPIFRMMIVRSATDQQNQKYNYSASKMMLKESQEYKLMYRLSALFLWYIKEGAGVSGFNFWNATGLEVEGYFVGGLEQAYNDAKAWHASLWKKLNRNQKMALGSKGNGGDSYNREYITGNRSSWTTRYNYWSDQLLAYVYYSEKGSGKDRFTNKTMKQVLLESIQRGYLN
ncbi:GDSL-like lipase/acylhydrolase family protein [Mycoplasmopsis mustelae]|uniref:GDSL-like lipase/acylhydrolase family protein n=1 Tax=Mycoplasmopsis mustelae TaxID=171289 RepID=A0A4R7UEB4_9BACT|nr:SGNH/GDSL hydrolase family protein [Mycoplasmopsis mustelae]TDV24271.1 GDSL-like lipase/acylhydrolase family protein [Mycoplasmopsis mustelae]